MTAETKIHALYRIPRSDTVYTIIRILQRVFVCVCVYV